jgi:hypothetical protein
VSGIDRGTDKGGKDGWGGTESREKEVERPRERAREGQA